LLLQSPYPEEALLAITPLATTTNLRTIYATAEKRLRPLLSVILDKFWVPDPDKFLVSYAVVPVRKLLKPLERKIIEERKPVFNVPRLVA